MRCPLSSSPSHPGGDARILVRSIFRILDRDVLVSHSVLGLTEGAGKVWLSQIPATEDFKSQPGSRGGFRRSAAFPPDVSKVTLTLTVFHREQTVVTSGAVGGGQGRRQWDVMSSR